MSPNNSPGVTEKKAVNLSPDLTAAERIKLFLDDNFGSPDYRGFDKDMIRNDLKLLSTGPGETVFELVVQEKHANTAGALHVGAAALMFDICTSTALATNAGPVWQYLGVTRNLNVTYIRPAPIGTTLSITSTVVHAGRQLVTIRGVATCKEDGEIVCTAEHLKFNFIPPAEKL